MTNFRELDALLRYDPKTGALSWRESRGRVSAGSTAGTINHSGYVVVCVDGRLYPAHRVAWLLVRRSWPQVDVDHKNGNRSDNRWCNLRVATRSQNLGNSRKHSDNKTGFKGVSFDASRGKFQAQIQVQKRRVVLGRFDSAERAHRAYAKAAARRFGEFARSA